MACQRLYQLPNKLLTLRQRSALSQGAFAAKAGMDPSRWCALEKGRRRITTAAALKQLLERLDVVDADRQEIQTAFGHDLVIASLAEVGFPEETYALVSRCLQASTLLTHVELRGLALTVESLLASKKQLNELSLRAQGAEEATMD